MNRYRQPNLEGLANHNGGAGAIGEADPDERGPAGGPVSGQVGAAVSGEAEGAQGLPGGAQQDRRQI